MTTIPAGGQAPTQFGSAEQVAAAQAHPLMSAAKSHDMALSMYKKTSKALDHLKVMNQTITKLAKMGDTVTEEDVVESAAELVSSGRFSANEAASILADMPQGKGLQPWIAMHLQKNMQSLKKLEQMNAIARHEVGASGLRLISGLSGHSEGLQAQAQASAAGPLAPTGEGV